MTKRSMDKGGKLTDNSQYEKEEIGALRIQVPVNRNLSVKLFGQLKDLIDRSI